MSRSGREARSEAREERGGGGRDRMRLKRGLQVAGRLQSQVGRWAGGQVGRGGKKGRDWRRFVHLHLAPRVVPSSPDDDPDTHTPIHPSPITHHPSTIAPFAHHPSPVVVAADALPRPHPCAPCTPVPQQPSSPKAEVEARIFLAMRWKSVSGRAQGCRGPGWLGTSTGPHHHPPIRLHCPISSVPNARNDPLQGPSSPGELIVEALFCAVLCCVV